MTYIKIGLYGKEIFCTFVSHKTFDMKKTFLILPLIVLATSACKKQTFDERVASEVELFNQKEAPKRLDMYTTFDSMAYEPSTQLLSYFYTIESDLDPSAFPKEEMRKELLKNLRSSIQLKSHKEHGISFRYKYYLKQTGKTIIDCTFTPEEYK